MESVLGSCGERKQGRQARKRGCGGSGEREWVLDVPPVPISGLKPTFATQVQVKRSVRFPFLTLIFYLFADFAARTLGKSFWRQELEQVLPN